jgi:Lrp/AsnC family transcriptional regulator, regulator for asnA, asnC and gidA
MPIAEVASMLDELAQNIIGELQGDARQSFREIGRKLKVSEGTVRNRVRSLLADKMVRITALPNPARMGLNFMCMVCIEVKVGTAEAVEKKLVESPNVYFLSGCTGTYDIIGTFMFHTPSEYDVFVKNIIANIPEITRTTTFVVMHVSRAPWEADMDVTELGKT